MPIVPASVHLARNGRGIVGPRHFNNRQRIHISTQANCRAWGRAVDHGNNTGLGDAGVHLVDANLAQAINNKSGGVDAIEGKFRMAVQMLTPALHFRRISGDTVQNGHGRLLFLLFDQT